MSDQEQNSMGWDNNDMQQYDDDLDGMEKQDIENQHPDLGLDHQLDAPGHGQDLMNGIETELVG